MEWKQIEPCQLKESPFEMIGNQWMLITAQKPDGSVNTMTASWGGMGVLWGKNVVFAFIRPQRYTKEFVHTAKEFTLTFFDESYKKDLAYLGKVSGKDEDKIAKVGFQVEQCHGAPVFQQASTAIVCKTLYTQWITPENFEEAALEEKWYTDKDYHMMYVAEIEAVYQK